MGKTGLFPAAVHKAKIIKPPFVPLKVMSWLTMCPWVTSLRVRHLLIQQDT